MTPRQAASGQLQRLDDPFQIVPGKTMELKENFLKKGHFSMTRSWMPRSDLHKPEMEKRIQLNKSSKVAATLFRQET